jgi:hypothetical protein
MGSNRPSWGPPQALRNRDRSWEGSGSAIASHVRLFIDPAPSVTVRRTARSMLVGSDTEEDGGSTPSAPTTSALTSGNAGQVHVRRPSWQAEYPMGWFGGRVPDGDHLLKRTKVAGYSGPCLTCANAFRRVQHPAFSLVTGSTPPSVGSGLAVLRSGESARRSLHLQGLLLARRSL